MLPIAEIASKSRWECGVGVHKGKIFLTNILKHMYPNEWYLQENNCHERLLKKKNTLNPMMLALSNTLSSSSILLLKLDCFLSYQK